VDAAALAGASAIPGGQDQVKNRADTFSEQNMVVNLKVDPNNEILPLVYNPDASPALNPAPGPDPWATCNAVQVNNAIPTPVFFGRLLNGGNPTTLINVQAVAALRGNLDLPFALLGCTDGLGTFKWNQTPDTTDNSAFTSYTVSSANVNQMRKMVETPCQSIPPANIGTCINLNNGQDTPVLDKIIEVYGTPSFDPSSDCFLVPVVSAVGKPVQCKPIEQFARICITNITSRGPDKGIEGIVTCNPPMFSNTPCSTPILVR
jgi:hypothetical protein